MFNRKENISQEAYFGILLSAILIITAIFFLEVFSLAFWSVLVTAITLFILACVKPRLFYLPLMLWLKLGAFLGKLVSPLALFVIFIIGFLPTGLLLKLFGKDLMRKEYDSRSTTYWVYRTDKNVDFKQQF